MSILTENEFAEGVDGCIVCPICKEIGSIESTGLVEEDSADIMGIKMKCINCKSNWWSKFKLIGYSELDIKGQDKA